VDADEVDVFDLSERFIALDTFERMLLRVLGLLRAASADLSWESDDPNSLCTSHLQLWHSAIELHTRPFEAVSEDWKKELVASVIMDQVDILPELWETVRDHTNGGRKKHIEMLSPVFSAGFDLSNLSMVNRLSFLAAMEALCNATVSNAGDDIVDRAWDSILDLIEGWPPNAPQNKDEDHNHHLPPEPSELLSARGVESSP